MMEVIKCVVLAVSIIMVFAGIGTGSAYLISKSIDKKKLSKNKKNDQ